MIVVSKFFAGLSGVIMAPNLAESSQKLYFIAPYFPTKSANSTSVLAFLPLILEVFRAIFCPYLKTYLLQPNRPFVQFLCAFTSNQKSV